MNKNGNMYVIHVEKTLTGCGNFNNINCKQTPSITVFHTAVGKFWPTVFC